MARRASQATMFHLPASFFFGTKYLFIQDTGLEERKQSWKMDEAYLEKVWATNVNTRKTSSHNLLRRAGQ